MTQVLHNNTLVHRLDSVLDEHLQEVCLRPGTNIYPSDHIDAVYFPISAMVALIGGDGKQVARIGNEGMVGFPVLLWVNEPAAVNRVIVSGTALKIAVGDLHQALERHPGADAILRPYVCDVLRQIMHEAACGQFHTVRQRCARWLVRTLDGTPQKQFRITQGQMAQFRGVRRATINPVLRDFRSRGFVEYARGKLTIINPAALEAATCGCDASDSTVRPTFVNHGADLITTPSNREASAGLVRHALIAN